MKFLHSADLHLGNRQYHMAQREADFYTVCEQVFAVAKMNNAELIVLAGDIFDAAKPPAYAVWLLREIVRKYAIEVAGIDGNHDAAGNDWLKVCGIVPLHKETITRNGIRFRGLNSMRPAMFYYELEQIPDNSVDVLVLHQAVSELANAPFADLSAMEMMPQLRRIGVRYAAMGDIHDAAERRLGNIWFAYPGSPEMTALDENLDKCCWMVDVTDTDVKLVRQPLRIRPIAMLTIRTQPEMDSLLMTMARQPETFAVIWYDPQFKDFESKLHSQLEGRLYVARPLTTDSELLGQMTKVAQVDRHGVLARQAEAVGAYFEEKSDAYQLTSAILQQPETVDEIVKKYMISKGLVA